MGIHFSRGGWYNANRMDLGGKSQPSNFNRKTQSESLVETRPAQSQACLCTFTTLKRYFLFAPCNYRSFSADVVTALLIVLDDPHGGPIFSQYRVGKNGRKFKLYKFRSMVVHAEDNLESLMQQNEMDGPVFKIKKDPRITRIGHFIRKTSIDELPQLFNILKGEMSIVGPRPSLPREVEKYTPYQMQRLLVTPGLTCYWQIQPQRNSLSFEEWVALDIQYIQDRSYWLDWKIIFKTVGAVLTCQGE